MQSCMHLQHLVRCCIGACVLEARDDVSVWPQHAGSFICIVASRLLGRQCHRPSSMPADGDACTHAPSRPVPLFHFTERLNATPVHPTGISARPSADAAAALEAGLLPCLTRMVTRMGAGSSGGAVWVPPDRFPGVAPCWDEAMLLGPLGQLSEFLSALGRRLRLAVEEVLAVAVGGGSLGPRAGPGSRGGGRSVGWLVAVAYDVMMLTHSCLTKLFLRVMTGDVVGARVAVGPGGEAAAAVASEGAPTAAPQMVAVRPSLAVAELLPALSRCVVVCAELGRAGAVRCGATVDGTADVMDVLLSSCSMLYGGATLDYTALLLARYMTAGLPQGGGGGGNDGGGGSGSGGGGRDCSSDGGSGGTGGGCTDTQWREFLLRDVRLMELLGAAVELYDCAATAAGAPLSGGLASPLVRTMCLAAAAFPGEFRAAFESGSPATPAATAGLAGSASAEAGAGGGGGVGRPMSTACRAVGAGGSGETRGSPLRISLQPVRSLMLSRGGAELEFLTRVFGGCDPAPETGQSLVRRYMAAFRQRVEGSTEALLQALLPPAEARGAVAAAAAAATASGSGVH